MSDTSTTGDTVLQQMQAWADDLLTTGNLPDTTPNEDVIIGQEIDESGSDTVYNQSGGPTNPLDVTNPGSAGQYSPYDSEDAGIQATLATLQSNDPQYYAALQSGTSLPADIQGLSEGTWEGYAPGPNQSYAGGVSSDIAQYLGGSSPTVTDTGTSIGSGGVTTPKAGKYDFFTEAMIQLNGVMHPKLSASVITTLGIGVIGPDLTMVMTRGLFATAFGAVGLLVLFGAASGGKISGADLPGLVAGFVAGPEIGAAHALSKLGIKGAGAKAVSDAGAYSPKNPIAVSRTNQAQQRIVVQQQLAQTSAARQQTSQGRLSLAQWKAKQPQVAIGP